MRRMWLLLTLLPIMAFLDSRHGLAYLAPPLDVSSLIRDSRLIVVGEVAEVWEDGKQGYPLDEQEKHPLLGASEFGRLMRSRLSVRRVLKGDAADVQSFVFWRSNLGDSGLVGVNEGEFGLFFFRDSEDGLTFTSHFYPKIIAGQDECATAGTPADRVAGELACVIESPTATVRDHLNALRALASVPGPSSTKVLRRSAQELPAPLNLLAAIELVERNDISFLPMVEDGARTSPTLRVSDQEHQIFEYHWGGALKGIKDPAAIPALARMLKCDDSEIRQGAVGALRNSDSDSALKPLSQALDDPDIWVRWKAVMGMATITHQKEWYPYYDDFKDNEPFFLDYWKAWAEQNLSESQ